MKIHITEDALKWFKEEVDLEPGDKINFFVQTYGSSKLHDNFTLGFKFDPNEKNASAETTVEDISFYVNESDEWFFKGYDLYIEYDAQKDEIDYDFK